jgi:hypothetical protein
VYDPARTVAALMRARLGPSVGPPIDRLTYGDAITETGTRCQRAAAHTKATRRQRGTSCVRVAIDLA